MVGSYLRVKSEGVAVDDKAQFETDLLQKRKLKDLIAMTVKDVGDAYGAIGWVEGACSPDFLKEHHYEFIEASFKTSLDEWMSKQVEAGMAAVSQR